MTDFQTTTVLVFITDEQTGVTTRKAYELPISPAAFEAHLVSKGLTDLWSQSDVGQYFHDAEGSEFSIFTTNPDADWVTTVSDDVSKPAATDNADTKGNLTSKRTEQNADFRDVQTVAELDGLNWTVPGASYKVPALNRTATKQEMREHADLEQYVIAACLAAFENFNGVSLHGEALKYFRTVAEVVFSASATDEPES